MQISRRVILHMATAGMLLAVFVWSLRRQVQNRLPETATNAPVANASPQNDSDSAPHSTKAKQATQLAPPAGIEEKSETYEGQMSAIMQSRNVPIRFWGKVVDQDDQPLAGVKITAHVRTWILVQTGMSAFPRVTAVSGNDGRFELNGANGDVLETEGFQKDGYESEPTAIRSFGFNTSEQFRSTPDFPVVFRLWQTNIHQELLTGQKSFRIEPDGRQYVINLNTGTVADSGAGDLKASIKHATGVVPGQTYEWVAELGILNGGLLEEGDPSSAMYLAPTGAYSSSFRYQQEIKGGQRGATGLKRFFVKLRNGQQYGRIRVEMFAPYNEQIPGLVRIQYAVNPSGSRILK